MKVVVHDRSEELPARVREYAENRLVRVGRHFDRVSEAAVEFGKESRRVGSLWTVDITLQIGGRRHPTAQAREAGPDPRQALDRSLDKIDRQVLKLKEKIKIERKRAAALAVQPQGEDVGGQRDPGPERIRMKLKPESPDAAEAALEGSAHPFYVFLDEGSGEINICYRRSDGGIAIVEPVVS